jgi:hypothetical protein
LVRIDAVDRPLLMYRPPMSAARQLSLLSITVLTTLGASVANAQPKKAPPPAPAPDRAAPATPAGGDAVAPIDDPPPSDMNGTDENPDAPKGTDPDPTKIVVAVPDKKKTAGYPMEEVLRPITLPQNMSEISLSPHAQISPYEGGDALRARYGITRQVQLGLTYVLGGVFHQPTGSAAAMQGPIKFKPGKAVGLDVTVLLQDWIGVRVGVPIYIDPVAVSITLGVPMKFTFGDKLALGAFDDLLNIRVKNFAPSFYQEAENARSAFEINNMTSTTASHGTLRFAGYGEYQQDKHLAIIARLGFELDDFSGSKNNTGHGGTTVFVRGGLQYAVKRYFDLGASIGWDDLAKLGSVSPALFAAVRI